MSSSKNLEFEKTSFLNKSNSAFIERMYLKFINKEADLPESWKGYFEGIGDELNIVAKEINGPSWGRFDELKVCTAYSYQGETISHLPYSLNNNEVAPQYTTLKGWKEDLTSMRNENELPETFIEYVAFIENFVKTPIRIVSVGPDRTQTIFRSSQ